ESFAQSRASIWRRWHGQAAHDTARPGQDARPGGRVSIVESIFRRLRFIQPDTRAVLLKDARTFWRDTTQWGQSVMLFGLLGVYVINLRHFTHQLSNPFWVNLISYLNLGACSLNLATVTTRFVFPQFSLEGRRLWIIGLALMGLKRVVKVSFWLASFLLVFVTVRLLNFSSLVL